MLDEIMNQGHFLRRMLQAPKNKCQKGSFQHEYITIAPNLVRIVSQEPPVVILTSDIFVNTTQDKIAGVDK